jgi:hypothetical protein
VDISNRITPAYINLLLENQVFVFGSNTAGRHGKGAAWTAYKKFGAVYGRGEGQQGSCYAIPTKDADLQTLPEFSIKRSIHRFRSYAHIHNDKQFLVTRIGCGLAQYTNYDIAPLFESCISLLNVLLPIEFWEVLMPSIAR